MSHEHGAPQKPIDIRKVIEEHSESVRVRNNMEEMSELPVKKLSDGEIIELMKNSGPLYVREPDKQFTKADMKSFGDHCRVVMNGRYSDQAMDALLDTWIETRKLHIK